MTESGAPPERTQRGLLQGLRDRARAVKRDTYALYFAARHPRTPWYAKVLAAAVVAYALSPFDLIPDFIPVIGYLDDLIIVPLGIAAVLRLVPADVLADCREQAQIRVERPVSWVGAVFMVAVWVLVATNLEVCDIDRWRSHRMASPFRLRYSVEAISRQRAGGPPHWAG